MKPSLTEILCTHCGLCCGGSLFADVELAPSDDTAALEALGLEIEDDDDRKGGELLLQPCAALRGRRCSIYPHRPKCCRTFECRLLRDVRRGVTEVSEAQNQIAEALRRISGIRELVARLGSVSEKLPLKERCMEILVLTESATDPSTIQRRDALEVAITLVEKQLQKTFLGVRWPHEPAHKLPWPAGSAHE